MPGSNRMRRAPRRIRCKSVRSWRATRECSSENSSACSRSKRSKALLKVSRNWPPRPINPEKLRLEAQSLDRQLRASLQTFSTQALDEYRQRLENASTSWLLTTVAKLNQQSESLIGQLTESTEKRLRSTCSAVVAEMGETLRQRMAGLFAPAAAQTFPAPPRTPVMPPPIKPEEEK